MFRGENTVTPESNIMESVESASTGERQAVATKEISNAETTIAVNHVVFIVYQYQLFSVAFSSP
jgi:hypothetical protein